MSDYERRALELRRTIEADPAIRFFLRNGFRIAGLDLLLVVVICVGLGCFSAWQIYDEALFAVGGLWLLWIDAFSSQAWRACWAPR